MTAIDMREVVELLNKNWMTHDGMWFAHCVRECGIETANKINLAAVRSMGAIEAKRIAKMVGATDIRTFEDFRSFFCEASDLVMPSFMNITYTFRDDGVLHCEWRSCFAHEGMKRIGMADRYQCGVFERIEAWLDALNVKYSVEPVVEGCMMHAQGECYRDYKLIFE